MRAFTIKASDIDRCPAKSFNATHYRDDGSCLCIDLPAMVHTPSMEAEGTMPRPKPTDERDRPDREGALQVLMTPEQRKIIDEMAEEDGLPTGAWLRMLGLREAKRRREKR